jgi:hypothetical protein
MVEKKRKKIKAIKKESEKPVSKEEQAKKENKIVRNLLIMVVVFMAGLLLLGLALKSSGSFKYEGIKFNVKKFCDSGPCLITYQTSLPVKIDETGTRITLPANKTADYNFYLRNDPRKLDVEFNGTLVLKKIMVLNSKDNFTCEGRGGIAGANLNQLYWILGINVIKDENATCDISGRYMLVTVQPGNKTSIEQVGPACYNINIKDCEVLEGTEKFMLETFVKINKLLDNATAAS